MPDSHAVYVMRRSCRNIMPGDEGWEHTPYERRDSISQYGYNDYTLAECTSSGNIGQRRNASSLDEVIALLKRLPAGVPVVSGRHPCFPPKIVIERDVEFYSPLVEGDTHDAPREITMLRNAKIHVTSRY